MVQYLDLGSINANLALPYASIESLAWPLSEGAVSWLLSKALALGGH